MKGNKNNSWFKELFASIKDFDKYQDYATEKTSKSIIYFLKKKKKKKTLLQKQQHYLKLKLLLDLY